MPSECEIVRQLKAELEIVRSLVYDDPELSVYQKWIQSQRGAFSAGWIAHQAWNAALDAVQTRILASIGPGALDIITELRETDAD